MTIALLTSVSLFALVVTSRPVLSDDVPAQFTFQTAVQAAFWIYPGRDDHELNTVRFQFQKAKQQIENLSGLYAENVPVTASFQILPDGTSSLMPTLGDERDTFDTQLRVDDAVSETVSSEFVGGEQEPPADEAATVTLFALAFSCVATILTLACVASILCIIKSLRCEILTSKCAWWLLPRFWRHPGSSASQDNRDEDRVSSRDCLLLQTEDGYRRPLDAEKEGHDVHAEDRRRYFDAISDMESEWDDVDEKYEDALDMTSLPLIHNLPFEPHASQPSHFNDPPLPSLGFCPPDQPTDDRSPLLMREMCSSPGSRPTWSIRAMDSPVLGIPSREGGGADHIDDVDATALQLALVDPRRRSLTPEFDIALTMQFRPGLGIGADAAWMVRFLMAIFGWFAVALTGQ